MHKVHVHDEFTLKSLKLTKVTEGKVMLLMLIMRSAFGALIVLFRSGQRMSSTSPRRTRTTMYSQDSAKLACVQQGREPNPPQQARADLGAGEFLLLRRLWVTDARTDPACICNQSRGDATTHASIEVTTGRGTPHSLTLDIPQRGESIQRCCP